METASGKLAGHGSSYRAEVVATVTLEGLVAGEPWAEWEAVVTEDPFAEHPEYDPHPAFAAAMRQALAPALAWLTEHRQGPAPPPGSQHLWQATLHDVLAAPPAVDPATVSGLEIILRRIGYLRPAITVQEVRRLIAQPAGVCLQAAPAPDQAAYAHGLAPGHCLSELAGQRLRHPASLIRAAIAPTHQDGHRP